MTAYFDHCDSGSTQKSLHQRALCYISEEFRSNLKDIKYGPVYEKNEEELIQKLFDKDSVNMRMYGSAKELLENIKIHARCPGVHRQFDLDLFPYFTTPMIYHNLKNEKFICKSDLFVMLQSMLYRSINNYDGELINTIVAFFLKSKEKMLRNNEFVPFDQKVLDAIWKEILDVEKGLYTIDKDKTFTEFKRTLPKKNFDQIFSKLKSYVGSDWDQAQTEHIKKVLRTFEACSFILDAADADTVATHRAFMFVESKYIITCLEQIMNKRPEMFLPQEVTAKPTVRLFEDGGQQFVMKAELFNALGLPVFHQLDFYIKTISFEEVLRNFKDVNFEFIRYPIQRTKHRAVPIPSVHPEDPKNFCIPAVDVLFEHLRSFLFGHKFFQKYLRTDWTAPQIMFKGLEEDFKPDYKTPYFLRTAALDTMEFACKTQLARFEWIPTQTIRNAKPDGFTVQNLKNELVYLDLHLSFPEIQDHAEVVYAQVDRVKREKVLRTCDLYDAVEYCQLICIFERLPNYKKFLHNQGGCGRVPGLNCAFCAKKLEDDVLKKAELEVGNIKLNAENEANKKVKEQLLEKISKLSIGSDH